MSRSARVARAALIGYLVLAAAAAVGLVGADWRTGNAEVEHLAPGASAWLGTDHLGRDVAAMTARATWTAVLLGGAAAAGAVLLGTMLGLLAGWRAGGWDRFILWCSASISSIPGILWILVVATALGPSLSTLIVAVILVGWVGVYRLVRSEARRLRAHGYVEASLAAGAPTRRVILQQLLPQMTAIMSVQFGLLFVGTIQAEAALSFLGLMAADVPSWGRMIAEAWSWDDLGHGRWWRLTAASLALGGLALAVLTLSRSTGSRRP